MTDATVQEAGPASSAQATGSSPMASAGATASAGTSNPTQGPSYAKVTQGADKSRKELSTAFVFMGTDLKMEALLQRIKDEAPASFRAIEMASRLPASVAPVGWAAVAFRGAKFAEAVIGKAFVVSGRRLTFVADYKSDKEHARPPCLLPVRVSFIRSGTEVAQLTGALRSITPVVASLAECYHLVGGQRSHIRDGTALGLIAPPTDASVFFPARLRVKDAEGDGEYDVRVTIREAAAQERAKKDPEVRKALERLAHAREAAELARRKEMEEARAAERKKKEEMDAAERKRKEEEREEKRKKRQSIKEAKQRELVDQEERRKREEAEAAALAAAEDAKRQREAATRAATAAQERDARKRGRCDEIDISDGQDRDGSEVEMISDDWAGGDGGSGDTITDAIMDRDDDLAIDERQL